MNITEVKRKINKLVKEIYPEEEYKTQRQHLAKKLHYALWLKMRYNQ